MSKKMMELLAGVFLAFGVLGFSTPAFAGEDSYCRWVGTKMVCTDVQPVYEPVGIEVRLWELATAERPPTAVRIASVRPSTPAERIKFTGQIDQWDDELLTACRRFNVPVELAKAIMLRESAGNPNAYSSAGAIGPMQLMPGTAKGLGVDPWNPVQNITGGVDYLSQLIKAFGGRLELVIAGYNSGEGNVRRAGNKIPAFRETQAYVPRVIAAYRLLLSERPVAGSEALRPKPGDPLYPPATPID